MCTMRPVTVMLTLMLAGAPAPGDDAAATRLERALYLEQTKGDLDAALLIYKHIAGAANVAPDVAAQALYRAGRCRERRGQTEKAVAAFEQVARRFPDQKQIVAKAQKRLDALRPAASSEQIEHLPPEVMAEIVARHMAASEKAKTNRLAVNTHVYGVDHLFRKYFGGFLMYHNDTDVRVGGTVYLGNFSEKPDFHLSDQSGVSQRYEVRDRGAGVRGGRHALMWQPDQPVAPGETRLLGYLRKRTEQLPVKENTGWLKMQNHFGDAVLENFFLVVHRDFELTSEVEPADRKEVGMFAIYLWQREVPASTTNRVVVTLKRPWNVGAIEPAGKAAPKAAIEAAEKWLATTDRGDYADSWAEAAPYFQSAISREKWDAALRTYRAPLGALKSRKLLSATAMNQVPGAPDGEYVIIRYRTSFEKKKGAIETVTPMKAENGAWRVSGYFIK
ncbi:MAG: hypothetical protein CMJ18_22750 [Phycisphaeraceae bacterium]|nr:hypothetical protein [Phycisphaeraceae bacterium]